MALNSTIFSPLTNYQGTISSYTHPTGNALQIISSSLPVYQATGWKYRISTTVFTTTSTTQQNNTNLTIQFENSKKYIIEGYLFGSTIRSANGFRVNLTTANLQAYYSIEVPSTTTAITYGNNALANAGSGGGNSLTNYYLVQVKGTVVTNPLLTPSITPSISSEGAGGGATDVAFGPSVIFYREF